MKSRWFFAFVGCAYATGEIKFFIAKNRISPLKTA
jgi:hypothetical protein